MQLELFIWIYRFSVWSQVLVAYVFCLFLFEGIYFTWLWVLFFILIKKRVVLMVSSTGSRINRSISSPHLSDYKSLLIGNFKRNLKPQMLMSTRGEMWHQNRRHFAHFSASNHWESSPSSWSIVSLYSSSSSKQYSLAKWTLEHFIRTKCTAGREMPSLHNSCYSPALWCCQKTCECWSREHGSQ